MLDLPPPPSHIECFYQIENKALGLSYHEKLNKYQMYLENLFELEEVVQKHVDERKQEKILRHIAKAKYHFVKALDGYFDEE